MAIVIAPSPTRTYVAICYKTNFDGMYFRRFILPRGVESPGAPFSRVLENSATAAEWYFLNHLNPVACIERCIPVEQYNDIKDQTL